MHAVHVTGLDFGATEELRLSSATRLGAVIFLQVSPNSSCTKTKLKCLFNDDRQLNRIFYNNLRRPLPNWLYSDLNNAMSFRG